MVTRPRARWLRRLLMLVLCALCACAGPEQAAPAPAPSVTAEPAQVPIPAAPLNLTMWHSWNGRSAQALYLLARRYEQGHPNVRITLEARPATSLVRDYSASVADGSAPQIVLVLSRYLGELADRRSVLPLDEQFTPEALTDLLPAALEGAHVMGRLHGVPLSYESLVLFYDRRRVQEAPATVEQLLAPITPGSAPAGSETWGLAYYLSAASAMPYLSTFGGGIFDADGDVMIGGEGREGTLRWLEWLQAMRADARSFTSEDFGAVDAMIQSSRVAAAVDWSHRLPAYEQIWGRDAVGVAPLPRTDGEAPPPATFVLADVASINSVTTAQQRTAAADFLLYLASASAQELLAARGGQVPANVRARTEDTTAMIAAASTGGAAFPNRAVDGRSWPFLEEMVRSVLVGSATPAEALDRAATALRVVAE
ncbi:MAG TPA: extracellular solute-binding protein [Herpetosiphonaceae bacterium]|nr:extracellular solute-binding protein [Herpetosiphonaceae bacterium]